MQYKIFVINLAKHSQRYKFMQSQLGALGLTPERIEAVNGAELNGLVPDVAPYAPLAAGEIGCFESHRKVWKKVVDEQLPGAFVLEDDTVVAADFASLDFSQSLLTDCDVIKLDIAIRPTPWYAKPEIELTPARRLRRTLGTEYSTAAYFVTQRGARRLLGLSRRYYHPVDHFMFDNEIRYFWQLKVQKVTPSIAMQYRMKSTEAGLPEEMADSIQSQRRPDTGWDSLSKFDQFRIRLRNLLEMDVGFLRRKRLATQLKRAADAGGIEQVDIPFESANLDHVAKAEAEVFGN